MKSAENVEKETGEVPIGKKTAELRRPESVSNAGRRIIGRVRK